MFYACSDCFIEVVVIIRCHVFARCLEFSSMSHLRCTHCRALGRHEFASGWLSLLLWERQASAHLVSFLCYVPCIGD